MQALIVDDEINSREVIITYIEKYCPEIVETEEANSVVSALGKIQAFKPDIIFLDIQLGSQNAFELLEQLDHINFQLIFITAYDHYAIKAFEFSAVHYLLKPIDSKDLVEGVKRCVKKELKVSPTLASELKTLYLNTSNKSYHLAHENILYILADGSYSTIYTVDRQKVFVSKKLGEYSALLSDDFFRIHHSILVNLNHIMFFDKKTAMVSLIEGTELSVSKRKKSALRNALEKGQR